MVNSGDDRSGPTGENGLDGVPPRWVIYLEDVLVILCILPLWPFILGYRGLAWQGLLYATVVLLLVILYRRWKRARAALEAIEKDGAGPQLPFMPPGRKL